MIHHLYKRLSIIFIALSLAGCQRGWQASPSFEETNVAVNKNIPADSVVTSTIEPYREKVTSLMTQVIGTSPVELRTAHYESPLGNFIVDLMLEQARKLTTKPVDLATTTNGGLRVPIPQGEIQTGNVFELMPFENELLLLTLDGPTVQELFDFAATARIAPLANATYTVQNGKAVDIKIGEKPFNPQQTYNIVTSDYLAGGGDNMAMFKKALKVEKLGVMMRDAIIIHIKELTAQGKQVTAATNKRVTVLP
jgi:2',3'-cyclic-nucleotide 2'-phosphodiesterase (5'-nucleotidase family)